MGHTTTHRLITDEGRPHLPLGFVLYVAPGKNIRLYSGPWPCESKRKGENKRGPEPETETEGILGSVVLVLIASKAQGTKRFSLTCRQHIKIEDCSIGRLGR